MGKCSLEIKTHPNGSKCNLQPGGLATLRWLASWKNQILAGPITLCIELVGGLMAAGEQRSLEDLKLSFSLRKEEQRTALKSFLKKEDVFGVLPTR